VRRRLRTMITGFMGYTFAQFKAAGVRSDGKKRTKEVLPTALAADGAWKGNSGPLKVSSRVAPAMPG